MVDKYNIFTVCNPDYVPFLSLFMCSLYDNVDLEPIDQIIVVNFGLSTELQEYFTQTFPKLSFLNAEEMVKSDAVHDSGWSKVTYSKVPYLKKVCETTKIPTLMVDVDSVFIGDISLRVREYVGDFVVCDRDREGFSKYIGSYFMVLNMDHATEFLTDWSTETLSGDEKHKESPALSRLVEKSPQYTFIKEPEREVSHFSFSQALDSEAFIVHLKSDAGLETIEKRITQPKVQPYLNRYHKEIEKCVAL